MFDTLANPIVKVLLQNEERGPYRKFYLFQEANEPVLKNMPLEYRFH